MTAEEKKYRRDARRNGLDAARCLADMRRHMDGVASMTKRLADGPSSEVGVAALESMREIHERGVENNARWAVAFATRAASFAHDATEAVHSWGCSIVSTGCSCGLIARSKAALR